MAHIDPTKSIDTLPAVAVADIDTEAEGSSTWLLIVHENEVKRISIDTLLDVIDTLVDEAGEVDSDD